MILANRSSSSHRPLRSRSSSLPAGTVGEDRFPELNRRLHPEECQEAREMARSLGLRNLDRRRPHPKLRRLRVI